MTRLKLKNYIYKRSIKRTAKDYNKKLAKEIKIFLKNKKKKSNNMVMNVTKIFQKLKNKSLFRMEKIL